ncbi:MAG: hypothetical protein JWM87_1091 [Candidatus Eremiobacteraeota bacterium]|nr:hypothetical protein [Candidatus Eremiobacteraeota bacterium]
MPKVYTRYVTWISRGKRHHGSAAIDLTPPLPPGDPATTWPLFANPSAMWSDMDGDHTAKFAFWSITGAKNGAYVSTNDSILIAVGKSDIHATAWYIPEGGGGDGGPGLTIDAFDTYQGTFVDDDFVDVVTDPSLTSQANNEGWVPTAAAEDVRAYDQLASTHAPFVNWLVIPAGGEMVMVRDLDAAAQSSAIAFAFYLPTHERAPHGGSGFHLVDPPARSTWVSWGVMVDGGGPTGNGPVDPLGPLYQRLAAGFALAETVSLVEHHLRGPLSLIATGQIESAARHITRAIEARAHQPVARDVNGASAGDRVIDRIAEPPVDAIT